MKNENAVSFGNYCLEADKITALVYVLGDSDPSYTGTTKQEAEELKEIREKLEKHLKDRIPDLEMFYDGVLEGY